MEGRGAHVEPRTVGGVVGTLGAGLASIARAMVGLLVVRTGLARVVLGHGLASTVHGVRAVEGLRGLQGLTCHRVGRSLYVACQRRLRNRHTLFLRHQRLNDWHLLIRFGGLGGSLRLHVQSLPGLRFLFPNGRCEGGRTVA